MGRTRCYILLMLCLLLPVSALAQASKNGAFELNFSEEGICRLAFHTGDIAFSQEQGNYVSLNADGMVNLAPSEGLPAFPQASRIVVLPRGAELRIEQWQATETEPISLPLGSVLKPWRGAKVKDAEPSPVEADKETYASNRFLRWGEPVEVENLGTMGDRQLFRVTVHPVAYRPATGDIVANQHLSAILTTTNSSLLTHHSPLPKRFLIVSRPQFREGLQPFVRWKRQEGYKVVELYSDTNRRDEVKALIDNASGDGVVTPWPSYILIVGDVEQIQAYVGTVRPTGLNLHSTDLYYADYTGDYLPDAILGRWPVNDTAELRAVVEKTLRYEEGRDLDSAALTRVLLVAGAENQEPAPVTTNGQVNYIKREIKLADPNVDTICYYNPSSSNQRNEILADMTSSAFVNYTAHCSSAGWSSPAVTFASVDTLDTAMPLFYVNNCCQSNNFSGTCFGEQLLRKAQGGAAGVIGATNSTLWNEDYYWAVGPKYPFSLDPQYDSLRPGAFDRWLGGEANSAGELLVAGNLAVTAFGSPYDRFYWEVYCLLGDPAMVPWMGVPQRVQLSVSDTIAVGTMELRVSGTPGATVSAMQGDELLGTVLLDEHRSVLLQLSRPIDTLPVLFTATKPRMLPIELTIPSAMPQGKAVAFTDATLGEGQVAFTLVNLGTDTLYGLTVTLEAADSGNMYASFTATPSTLDTLPPQASHTTYLPLHIDRWAPLLATTLTATDADGESWHLALSTPLGDMLPELAFTLRNADTTVTNKLRQGGSYLVGATPTGYYDTMHVSATSLPDVATFENNGGWLPVTVGDSATHLHLTAYIARGNYSRSYEYYLNVGGCTDGFADGMAAYPWQTGGTQPWTVDSSVSHTGRYSLRSGVIEYRQTSELAIELLIASDDSISFWLRTSTELDYDKFRFSIDGVKVFEASGENAWHRYAYPLTAGHHILSWRYTKDEGNSEGSDCVWIDDVQLPLALWSAPCAAQGDEGSVGIPQSYVTNASLSLYPNPTTSRVLILTNGLPMEELRVVDIYGRMVYSSILHSTTATLDLPALPTGIYFVETRSNATLSRAKLIIQRH